MENVSIGTRLMSWHGAMPRGKKKKKKGKIFFSICLNIFSGLSYIINRPPTLTKHLRIFFFFSFLCVLPFSDSFISPFYPSWCQLEEFQHGRRHCPADRTAKRTGQTRRRFPIEFFQPTCSSRRQLLGPRYRLHQLLDRLDLPNFQRQKHS